jgi:hypothetical protein
MAKAYPTLSYLINQYFVHISGCKQIYCLKAQCHCCCSHQFNKITTGTTTSAAASDPSMNKTYDATVTTLTGTSDPSVNKTSVTTSGNNALPSDPSITNESTTTSTATTDPSRNKTNVVTIGTAALASDFTSYLTTTDITSTTDPLVTKLLLLLRVLLL